MACDPLRGVQLGHHPELRPLVKVIISSSLHVNSQIIEQLKEIFTRWSSVSVEQDTNTDRKGTDLER